MRASAQLVVIAGFEKCWTTSIANFMLNNQLCELLVTGVKEPFVFSRHGMKGLSILPGRPVLDASQSYVNNPAALDNIRPHRPKIILLYRNPYNRAYSAFRMYKVLLSSDPADQQKMQELVLSNKHFNRIKFAQKCKAEIYHSLFLDILGEDYYVKTRHYIDIEIDRIRTMSFIERLRFERSFFESKGYFPYFSILVNSLFYRSTQFVLERFPATDILPISVHRNLDTTALLQRLACFIGVDMPESIHRLENDFDITGSFDFKDQSFENGAHRAEHAKFFENDIGLLKNALHTYGCDMTFFCKDRLLEQGK